MVEASARNPTKHQLNFANSDLSQRLDETIFVNFYLSFGSPESFYEYGQRYKTVLKMYYKYLLNCEKSI